MSADGLTAESREARAALETGIVNLGSRCYKSWLGLLNRTSGYITSAIDNLDIELVTMNFGSPEKISKEYAQSH